MLYIFLCVTKLSSNGKFFFFFCFPYAHKRPIYVPYTIDHQNPAFSISLNNARSLTENILPFLMFLSPKICLFLFTMLSSMHIFYYNLNEDENSSFVGVVWPMTLIRTFVLFTYYTLSTTLRLLVFPTKPPENILQ